MARRITRGTDTVEDGDLEAAPSPIAIPGLVLVFSGNGATIRTEPVGRGVDLGRGDFGGTKLEDDRASRDHAHVAFDDDGWSITDRASRNGTYVDGEKISGTVRCEAPRTVRIGRSIFLPVRDIRRFERATVARRGDALVGPTLAEPWDQIERAARYGDALLITGESGVGKELAARAFHDASERAAGPFIAVNCAAIPEGLAERLLFGTRRGAYSGANADADGYVQAADGGTLFLDEVADLDVAVQAKLLRVLESKEVLALGAARTRKVDVRVCSATHDLRGAVAAGRFREDLFFRVGRPEIVLPALRDRPEEIAWLVAAELTRVDASLSAQAPLIETCIVRRWPGNVRELLGEIRRAAHEARADGRSVVEARDLAAAAGAGFEAPSGRTTTPTQPPPNRDAIENALRAASGNVTGAARALGLHRNQLRRFLGKAGIDPKIFGDD